jgi:hypothetical protein
MKYIDEDAFVLGFRLNPIHDNFKIPVYSDEEIHTLIKMYGKEMVLSMAESNTLIYLEPGIPFTEAMNIEMEYRGDNDKLFMRIYRFMKDDQLPGNKAILNRLYDRFYKSYVAKYKKKFEGIDLEIDPITGDTMIIPAYIEVDWDNDNCDDDCKIVYSRDTIIKRFRDGNHFLTPNTKKKFMEDHIMNINLNLLKN